MKHATVALTAAVASSWIVGGAPPAKAASGDETASRVDSLEKEVRALRRENKILRSHKEPSADAPATVGRSVSRVVPASAARAYAAAPAPAPVGSWTGFYVGGNLGLSVGRDRATETRTFVAVPPAAPEPISDSVTLSPLGAIGGGQIGFNFQPTANWVLGVEADFQGSGQKYTACIDLCSVPGLLPGGNLRNVTVSQQLDWFGTVRGRLGWTNGPVLFYGTGGLAYGRVRTDESLQDFNFGLAVNQSSSTAQTKTGFAVGGGAEMQLFGNWTGRIEYLYLDLGSVSGGNFVSPFTVGLTSEAQTHSFTSSVRDNIVRAAINYKFGDPVYAPGVAPSGMVFKAPAALPAAIYNWTGFYVGANVGGAVARNTTTTPLSMTNTLTGVTAPNGAESFVLSPVGVIGGGQAGFNWQAAQNWLIGLEADFQGSGQESTACLNCGTITTEGPIGTTLTQRLDWFGTVRGRLGWANGPVLLYATGGLAYGHVSTDEVVQTIPALTSVTTSGSFSSTRTGWTAGAGAEAQLFGNWSAKAEYLYVDLGSVSGSVFAPSTVIPAIPVSIFETRGFNSSITDHIFRVGVNYRFAPGAVAVRD